MVLLTREQIEARLVALHRASLELVSDLSLEVVLERIAHLAGDNRSIGFPPSHPPMSSFLGVPILTGNHLLGQIYLTDKEDYTEFTRDDERVIETLAAYAAVAILNARMYEELKTRDMALSQRTKDLGLLNDIGEMLANANQVDEILEQTLDHVMSYLEVEAGEIFLTEEDGLSLRMAMHRGENAEAFWTKDQFRLGEGFIGLVAESGKPLVSNTLQPDLLFLRRQEVNT